MSTATIESAALTLLDRCDRCGAQALVRVVLPNGDLLFCGHHYAKHAPTLKPVALRVENYTEQLIPATS